MKKIGYGTPSSKTKNGKITQPEQGIQIEHFVDIGKKILLSPRRVKIKRTGNQNPRKRIIHRVGPDKVGF